MTVGTKNYRPSTRLKTTLVCLVLSTSALSFSVYAADSNAPAATCAATPSMNQVLNPSAAPNSSENSTGAAMDSTQDEINKVPLEYSDQSFSAEDIVEDKLNLLPQDFKISPAMKKRVLFWLDVYTKYSSHFSLIHDANRPWIVYRVVDLRGIYDRPVNRFVKDANDHRAVAKAKAEVRSTLAKLARKKSYASLSGEEYKIYKLLEEIPGPRKQVFKAALRNLRDQRGQKNFYLNGLMYSSRYLNEMEEIFARYDLPVELVRLPLVESSFNEEAQSKVGASGIWQFMPSVGKQYLKMSKFVDERNSPIKATEAAAKLMLMNFKITHTWPLAITAYNHGAGGVVKACKRLKTTNIADLVDKYHTRSFSFASQNFFSEFIAALYGEKYQDRVFGNIPKYPALAGEKVTLQYSMRAKTLTNISGVTIEELKLFNPDLKSQAVAGSTYLPRGLTIRLPVGHGSAVELFNQRADEARMLVSKNRKSKT